MNLYPPGRLSQLSLTERGTAQQPVRSPVTPPITEFLSPPSPYGGRSRSSLSNDRSLSPGASTLVPSSLHAVTTQDGFIASPVHRTAPPPIVQIWPQPVSATMVADSKYSRDTDRFLPKKAFRYLGELPAMTFVFDKDVPIEDWQRRVSPAGNVYFSTRRQDINIYSHSNLMEPENLKTIEIMIDEILFHLSELTRPDDTEIVVDHKTQGYYLFSWSRRCIFWIHGVVPHEVLQLRFVALSISHLEHAMQKQFWSDLMTDEALNTCGRTHVEMFPLHYKLAPEHVNVLKAELHSLHNDVITSHLTTSLWNESRVDQMVKNAEKIKVEDSENQDYYLSSCARLMALICDYKFNKHHGEACARLARHDSIYRDQPSKGQLFFNIFFNILSILLWGQPALFFQELRKIWVDDTIARVAWFQLAATIKKDWEEAVLPATVLLATNVGLLSIQSIDNLVGSWTRSAAQLCSYTSTLLSLSNVLAVYVLRRQFGAYYADYYDLQADMLIAYFIHIQSLIGLPGIAVMISLPTALSIWSAITFLISLAFVFLYKTTTSTKWFMGTILILLLAVLFIILVFGYLVAKFTSEDTLLYRLANGISVKLTEWKTWQREHAYWWRKTARQSDPQFDYVARNESSSAA